MNKFKLCVEFIGKKQPIMGVFFLFFKFAENIEFGSKMCAIRLSVLLTTSGPWQRGLFVNIGNVFWYILQNVLRIHVFNARGIMDVGFEAFRVYKMFFNTFFSCCGLSCIVKKCPVPITSESFVWGILPPPPDYATAYKGYAMIGYK